MTGYSGASGQMPAASIVMPSFGHGRFIEAAVRSVLACNDADIEVIVVDGGSLDDTLDRLVVLSLEFAGRLQWWSAPDAGPASAVNAGVARARAPIVGWLNADDLYAPGAVDRAVGELAHGDNLVMVYGEGEHVDELGVPLERYPTRGPETPLQGFADGCFICQPTAFFTRDMFLAIGGLDTTLGAAFDFDLWMRVFASYPRRIGFVPTLQAQTRLHAATITAAQRGRVALEGVRVVARHLGHAPAHWLHTHFDELAARHPFHASVLDLPDACRQLIDAAGDALEPAARRQLHERLQADSGLRLSTPWMHLNLHADGWAGRELTLKLRQPPEPVTRVELHCSNATALAAPLRLTICKPDEPAYALSVDGPGGFVIGIDIADRRPDARIVCRIVCRDPYVPSRHDAASDDHRALAFRVDMVLCR